MFAIIVGSTILLLALVALFAYLWTWHHKGDLTRPQEVALQSLLKDAAYLMHDLGPSLTVEETDILTRRSEIAIDNWLARYKKLQKEIHA